EKTFDFRIRPNRLDGIANELRAINELLQVQQTPNAENGRVEVGLPVDSAVCVCWYSQLCELLERAPDLATKLNVCGLPGRGFRGDWYLRVEPGSVSLRLGRSIVTNLVSAAEDYERCRAGLGLPAGDKIMTSRLPVLKGAMNKKMLDLIIGIWKKANKR